MRLRRVLLLLFCCGILFSDSAFAGSKKKSTPAPEVQAPTIAAVTADSITVKDPQGTKTLAITQFTEINVNGRKASAAELKQGMTVSVTLGTDPSQASRINAMAK